MSYEEPSEIEILEWQYRDYEQEIYELQDKFSIEQRPITWFDEERNVMVEEEGTIEEIHGDKDAYEKWLVTKKTIESIKKDIDNYYSKQVEEDNKKKTEAVEQKKESTILNKALAKTESKLAKQITDEFGINIPELEDDKLHQYLKEIPLYQTFYALWRMRIDGNYRYIPVMFIVMMASVFRYNNYIRTKEYNYHMKAMDTLIFAGSGTGKSHTVRFIENLLKLTGHYTSSWRGTVASIKGSVTDDKNLDNCSIQPGILAKPFNMDDEFRTLLDRAQKQDDLKPLLLNVTENEAFQGDQKQTKTLADKIMDWHEKCLIMEKQIKENRFKDDKEKKEFIKKYNKYKYKYDKVPKFELETNEYKIDVINDNNGKKNYDIFWKIRSTQLFLSTVINSNATQMEINAQETLGISQGLYNRILFLYFPKKYTSVQLEEFEDETSKYIKRLEERYSNIGNIEKYFENKFKDLFSKYKQATINITKSDLAPLKKQVRKHYTEERLKYRARIDLPDNDEMQKYEGRLEYNTTKTMLLLLSYLKNKNFPGDKEIEVTAYVTNLGWHSFYDYLNENRPVRKKSTMIQTTDYVKIIMNEIASKFLSYIPNNSSIQGDWVERYANAGYIKSEVEKNIKLTYGKFNNILYNKAVKELEKMNKIEKMSKHPIMGVGFGSGIRKFLIIKRSGKNKEGKHINEYITNEVEMQEVLNKLGSKGY